MYNLIKILSVILFLALPTHAFAVEMSSIYEVDVPVASHADNVRAEAIKKALEGVLIKASGNTHVMDTYPKLKAGTAHADDLVQEFSYTAPPQPSKTQPFLLVVRFDPDGVNKLLQDAGSSVWGKSRPLILVWLANEAPNRPIEIVSSSENPIQNILTQDAKLRGLPVIFPVMDVGELTQITPTDVINKSLPILQPASQRYASNAILIGHLTQANTGINSEWQLILGADQWNFKFSGKDLPDVFNALVSQISDTLAKRYATVVTPTVSAKVVLKVTGLKQQTDLAHLMKYLQQLASVAGVQLQSVNGTDAVLAINLHGDQNTFIQALALGSNLQPVANSNPQDPSLQYQWKQ